MLREREHCLCGVHVHKGTLIAGIVFLILSIISLATSVSTMISAANNSTIHYNGTATAFDKAGHYWSKFSYTYPIVSVLLYLIYTIFLILLIVGNRQNKPGLYKPYLIFMLINIITGFILAVVALLCGIIAFVSPNTLSIPDNESTATGLGCLILAFILLVTYFLEWYFLYHVPKRSQELLYEEQGFQPGVVVNEPRGVVVQQTTTYDKHATTTAYDKQPVV